MKEVLIPVGKCPNCEKFMPVVVEDIDIEMLGRHTIIYCPSCSEIINNDRNIELRWYTPEELEKDLGWRMDS